jgi:hypothetical protein
MEAGLDPDELAARYGPERVSQGLRAQWRAMELAQRAAARARAGDAPESPAEARQAIEAVHARINDVYREAEARLLAVELRAASRQGGEDVPTVADIERGVAAQFDAPPDAFSPFEGLVIARGRAGEAEPATPRGVELFGALKAVVEDLESGRLEGRQRLMAGVLISDTLHRHGARIRAALERGDTEDMPSADPEGARRQAERSARARLESLDRLERIYGADLAEAVRRLRQEREARETERELRRDRGRDDDGYGF